VLLTYRDVIEAYSLTVGAGSAFGGGGSNEKLANFFVSLREERSESSGAIMERLRADLQQFTDFSVTVSQPNAGPPTGAPIGIRLLGEDLDALQRYAIEIARLLSDIEGTTNIETSTNSNSTEIVLDLDTAKAAAVGLNPQTISQTLRAAIFGSEATTLTTLTDDIPVVVRLNLGAETLSAPAQANRTTVDRLRTIELTTPQGERVLLGSLVDIRLRESTTVINHEDQERVVSISAETTPDGNVREINDRLLERVEAELSLPESITLEFGGETEESNEAFGELFLALIVGVVLMLAILVLQFDSYLHTFYVLSILPFSLIGILFGLGATGSALSFPSIMGFIALSGIVVNNSILLIDQMNAIRKREPERGIQSVVTEAATSRLRPILLTSITTVTGMIPLLTTDEIWIPLATAIMFGLTFSVIITLVLIPVIYSKYPGEVRN
jgi:HAE1 family hydrophobic/amphiphilic exporter-1